VPELLVLGNFDDNIVHLAHRDVTMVAVSRAPYRKLAAYRKRTGWTFKWLSSAGNGGIDILNAAYNYLDLVPKGRDEAGHAFTQFWVRRHDMPAQPYSWGRLAPNTAANLRGRAGPAVLGT